MIKEIVVNYDTNDCSSFDVGYGGGAFFCRNRFDSEGERAPIVGIVTRDNARDLASHLQRWADTGRWNDEDVSPFVNVRYSGDGGVYRYQVKNFDYSEKAPLDADSFAADRAERDAAPPSLDNGATPEHKWGDHFATSDNIVLEVDAVYNDGIQYVYEFFDRGSGGKIALSQPDLVKLGWRKLRKVAP